MSLLSRIRELFTPAVVRSHPPVAPPPPVKPGPCQHPRQRLEVVVGVDGRSAASVDMFCAVCGEHSALTRRLRVEVVFAMLPGRVLGDIISVDVTGMDRPDEAAPLQPSQPWPTPTQPGREP